MYMIMALAEKADIEYSLEAGDDEAAREMSPESQIKTMEKGVSDLEEMRKLAASRVSPQSVPTEIKEIIDQVEISPSLLEKVKEESNNSLLSKEV